MANAWYLKGLKHFAKGEILWLAAGGSTIRCCFVKAAYTENLSTHEWFSDLGANVVGNSDGATRASCPAMTLIDAADEGILDAQDTSFTGITAGPGQLDNIVIFKDSGADGTSPLLVFVDTATGLPFTGSGATKVIVWPDTAGKIAKL